LIVHILLGHAGKIISFRFVRESLTQHSIICTTRAQVDDGPQIAQLTAKWREFSRST
jgi:hypothetical protein